MKQSTYEKKLIEKLGLQDKLSELGLKPAFEEEPKRKKNDKYVGIPEEEIQRAREAQGIYYFLQAPDLFSSRICRHCGAPFLVSRQFVALCSYTCMEKELEKFGVEWSRKKNAESFGEDPFKVIAETVYEGNEPIWIRNIETIRSLIDSVESTKVKNTKKLSIKELSI